MQVRYCPVAEGIVEVPALFPARPVRDVPWRTMVPRLLAYMDDAFPHMQRDVKDPYFNAVVDADDDNFPLHFVPRDGAPETQIEGTSGPLLEIFVGNEWLQHRVPDDYVMDMTMKCAVDPSRSPMAWPDATVDTYLSYDLYLEETEDGRIQAIPHPKCDIYEDAYDALESLHTFPEAEKESSGYYQGLKKHQAAWQQYYDAKWLTGGPKVKLSYENRQLQQAYEALPMATDQGYSDGEEAEAEEE